MENRIKTAEIGNGITLYLYQSNSFKTACASINIAMPLDDGENAARAVLIRLLSRGNANYPTIKSMSQNLCRLYDTTISPQIFKSGDTQILRLSLNCIDDKFALDDESILTSGLNLLFDMLFKPVLDGKCFPDKDVKREKRLLIQYLESLYDDKMTYSVKRLMGEMFKDEAYSIEKVGTQSQLEAVTGKDVYAAYCNILSHAPIQINIIGNFDEKAIINLVKNRFSSVERKNISKIHTEIISQKSDEKTIRETQDINQCKIVMGFRAGSNYQNGGYAPLKVMTDIFGGDTYSKLFINVREKLSLCYYCTCAMDKYKGVFFVQCGVDKDKIQLAIDAVKNELKQIALGNFDDDVIKASKMSISGSFDSIFDKPENIDLWYSNHQTERNFKSPSEIRDEINEVTKDEIMDAASCAVLDTVFILEN